MAPSKQMKAELHQQVQGLQKKQQSLYKEHKALKQTQREYNIIEQNLAQLLQPTPTKSLDREQ